MDVRARVDLARNTYDENVLSKLASDNDARVRAAVANNLRINVRTMEKLLEDVEPRVRSLATKKKFFVDRKLSKAEYWAESFERNDFLLREDLSYLSVEEKDRLARITNNTRTLKVLASDDDDDVRRTALAKL